MRPQRAVDDERLGPYEFSAIIGQSNTGAGFSHPVAIAIDHESGTLYVASRRFARVSKWARDGYYLGQFGRSNPTDFSEVPVPDERGVYWPSGVAYAGYNGDGVLYLTEEAHHRVRKISPDGRVLAVWGTGASNGSSGSSGAGPTDGTAKRMPRGGSEPGRFIRPAGIAVYAPLSASGDDHAVFVVDALNHRVQRFDPAGRPLAQWGSRGAGPGEFDHPWGIAVDSAWNRVYVSDWRNDRVQVFDVDGRFIASFGRSGTGPGEFNRPAGVAVDPQGNVAVADWRNDRVQVLDPGGQPLAVLVGHGDHLSKAAQQTLTAREEMARQREQFGGAHPLDRFMWLPTDVAFDADGTLYVTDTLRQRLQVYRRAQPTH